MVFDPAWMVLQAATPAELATAKSNGATHSMVEVKWIDCQTTSGGAVDATTVIANVNNSIAAGLKICLRVSLQYIPVFVDTSGVKFRRNGAVDWTGVTVNGDNIRDWVWSASTRALVDDFLTKLFNQLDWSKVDRVQLGGLMFGELSYPTSDGTQWWGFSAPAQTGTGLAAGMVVCPVPGYTPSTGTTWVANDIAFVNWYADSLNRWMLWLIAKYRLYYLGPIWVMHPGFGWRSVSQTPTSGTQALNYRLNQASGLDWYRQISAYPDANVHPYSTWGDGTHPWLPDPFSDTNDGNAAAWYHLLRVARTYNRHARIWGENTGSGTNLIMNRVFTEGAVAFGYEGFAWLSHSSLSSGTDDTYANWVTQIASVQPSTGTYIRGVNTAGGEFSPAAATLPGVYNTDYAYDSLAAFTALAARGHKVIRLPFRWERIQPVRSTALSSAELTRLQGVVADIASVGMTCILDVHNFGRYINSTANGGAELILGSTLPTADLTDLWTRLSTAFKNNAGIHAYGLMNEPHDLPLTGGFAGTTRYDWNDGTVQGWSGDTAAVSNVGSKLRFALTPPGSAFYQARKDDVGADRNGPVTGNVLEADVTLSAGTPGSWGVILQWQTTGFVWQSPPTTTYTRIDTGAAVGGLVAGVAVRVRATYAANIPAARPFAVQIECNSPTAGTYSADVDNFAQGTTTGGSTGAQVWQNITQNLVTAIRNNGDSTRILVPGYGYSGAQTWVSNHPTPWITDPSNNVVYEAHYYFDIDNSGDYPDAYATEQTAAVAAGFDSVVGRAVTQLSIFTNWLKANNVRGSLGEFGWPNNGDTDSWNAVGEAIYVLLDRRKVDADYWSAGARWGTSYNLSIYTGAAQDVVKTPAVVVERHLTTGTLLPPPPPPPPVITPVGVGRNLIPNPALANDSVGYVSTPAGAYVRSTSVNAGLPRTTGLEGSVIADCNTPRFLCTAGQQVVVSVSIAGVAAQAFNILVNFYDAPSGGLFIANSGPTTQVVLAPGQVQRYVLGPFTCPAGTQSAHLKLNDMDAGGVEVTALRACIYSGNLTADGVYFDGASPGASWDGTAGSSTSSRLLFADTAAVVDAFSVTPTALGPVATDAAVGVDAFSIAVTGVIFDQAHAIDGFLIAQLEFDDARGRNRLSAFTFGLTVLTVRVQRRPVGGKYELVRGGEVPVSGGIMIRPVDDYEFAAGVDTEYLIEGLTDTGVVVQSAVLHRFSSNDSVWLKSVASPQYNRRVNLVGWGEVRRDSRAEIFPVQGRSDPVVITDVHSSRSVTIKCVTHTVDETDALDDALSQGIPMYLQVPRTLQLPTLYASVGDYTYAPLTQRSVRSLFTIPLTEVSPPPVLPGIGGGGGGGSTVTYAQLLIDYLSYQKLFDAKHTYRELLAV